MLHKSRLCILLRKRERSRVSGVERHGQAMSHYLDQMHERYKAGDQSVVVYGLHYCITNETPIPEWLATAFDQACDKVRTLEVKSWDDVFGRPLKKGKRLATERRNLKIESELVDAVSDRHAAGA